MSKTKKYGEIKQKAWCIDWSKIDEGYYYSGNIDPVYANSRSKARSIFFKETNICDYQPTNMEDIEYITIPLLRDKECDKFEYKGEILSISEIERKKLNDKRLTEFRDIENDESITHCYIYKNGYYYADNHCGYVSAQNRAGIYTKKDALSSGRSCRELHIEPVNTEDHNKMVNNEIEKLKNRLIK